MSQAGGHSQPSLLPQLNHHAIWGSLDEDRQCSFTAGIGSGPGGNLHFQVVVITDDLGAPISPVKVGNKRVGDVFGAQVAVIDSLFHGFDYNHLYQF